MPAFSFTYSQFYSCLFFSLKIALQSTSLKKKETLFGPHSQTKSLDFCSAIDQPADCVLISSARSPLVATRFESWAGKSIDRIVFPSKNLARKYDYTNVILKSDVLNSGKIWVTVNSMFSGLLNKSLSSTVEKSQNILQIVFNEKCCSLCMGFLDTIFLIKNIDILLARYRNRIVEQCLTAWMIVAMGLLRSKR